MIVAAKWLGALPQEAPHLYLARYSKGPEVQELF